MATLNFYLDRADKQGNCFILMTYLANGQKFRHSLKLKVSPSDWQTNKQRLKERNKEDQIINAHIDNLEGIVKEAQTLSLLNHNGIDFSFVKQHFEDALGKKDINMSLIDCFKAYIEHSRTSKKPKTTARYVCCLNHLLAFRKLKRYELTFERINQQFYEQFISYLMQDRKQLNNTVGSIIKTIKSFLNFCAEKGYAKANNEVRKFKVFKDETEMIYLTEEELMKIYQLENLNEQQQVVRDNFCFACFTGLRYSDMYKLQAENIKADYIELKTEKTREFLKIPLNRFAKALLSKNKGMLPKLYSNQRTNELLRELGQLVNIDSPVQIIKYRGANKVEFNEPKYKFMGTHTARRTFVTLCLEKGMRPETVMSITGHKDYKTFKKYIKLTDKVKLTEMNAIWGDYLQHAG